MRATRDTLPQLQQPPAAPEGGDGARHGIAIAARSALGGSAASKCAATLTAASIQAKCYNVANCTLGGPGAPPLGWPRVAPQGA